MPTSLDAILSSMSITAERRKAVDFTDRYYRLLRMLAAPGTDTAVGSFRGKRIGTLLGSTQHALRAVTGAAAAPDSRLPPLTSALDDLAAGQLAGVFVDALAGEAYLSRPGTAPKFTFVGPAFDDPAYFGEEPASRYKGNAALQTALNAAIGQIAPTAAMTASGRSTSATTSTASRFPCPLVTGSAGLRGSKRSRTG